MLMDENANKMLYGLYKVFENYVCMCVCLSIRNVSLMCCVGVGQLVEQLRAKSSLSVLSPLRSCFQLMKIPIGKNRKPNIKVCFALSSSFPGVYIWCLTHHNQDVMCSNLLQISSLSYQMR